MNPPRSAAELYAALREPFQPADLEWRALFAKKGRNDKPFVLVAPYVNRPALINRLNQVCGVGGWQSDARVSAGHVYVGVGIKIPPVVNGDGEVVIASEWVWRWDGAGFLDSEPDRGFGADAAGKGDFSNAFKRACELFGIALYLREVGQLFGIVHDNGRYSANLKGGGTCKWDPPGLDGKPSYPGEIPGFELNGGSGVGVEEGSPPRSETEAPGTPAPPPPRPKAPTDEEAAQEIQRCKDVVRTFMAKQHFKSYHLEGILLVHPKLKHRYQSIEDLRRLGTLEDWQLLEQLTIRNRLLWDDAQKELAKEFPTGPERLAELERLVSSVRVEAQERVLISSAIGVGWNDAVEWWIEELSSR